MMEAIILAGGRGTRLKPVVSDVPKVMADVAGQPFLYYILRMLENSGFNHVILAVGYKHEIIEEWLKSYSTSMLLSVVIENVPLGTGGALRQSLTKAKDEDVFIINGDTFFEVDYSAMKVLHKRKRATCTLALKRMESFERYGTVCTSNTDTIIQFREKEYCESGLINGGVYLLQKNTLVDYPDKFSLEKDFFERVVPSGCLSGFVSEGYFIDIGIPEDYKRVQTDFIDGKAPGL